MKNILPIILIVASLGLFFLFTNPTYVGVKELKLKADSYNEALDNSKKLQAVRDVLVSKYNSFSPEAIDRLKKLLPDNVDNIKVILEIGQIAGQYDMQVKNVKYDTLKQEVPARGQFAETGAQAPKKDYGDFDLEFSVEGPYANFTGFLESLEKSLRIVDIQSISFSSIDQSGTPGGIKNYKYDFKVKTYWLKG